MSEDNCFNFESAENNQTNYIDCLLTDEEKEQYLEFSSKEYLIINKKLLKTYGPLGAIFISNLIDKFLYFLKMGKLSPEGTFFHTHKQQADEMYVKEETVKRLKKSFIEKGILLTKMKSSPAKEHYKIDINKLKKSLVTIQQNPRPQDFSGSDESEGLDPSESHGHIKNLNTNELKNEKVSKDTLNEKTDVFSPDQSFTHQKHSRRTSQINTISQTQGYINAIKNSSQTKQTLPPNKFWIENGWKKMVVDEWNKIPKVSHHRDMSTKTACNISKYLTYLNQGIFFNQCSLNPEFLKRNNIPNSWITDAKKFTLREILNAIKEFALYLQPEYWPPNKKNLPRTLDSFLYNPISNWSKNGESYEKLGSSFFLRCAANPGTSPMKVVKDHNPQYTRHFERIIKAHFDEDDYEKIYRGINALETRVFRDKVFNFNNGSGPKLFQVIGSGPGKLEPMFKNYASYLNEYNRIEDPDELFNPYGMYFRDFLETLQKDYSSFKVNI